MRKLIVRAFNVSLDGVSAEYGTDYFDWCMSGIDPRVSEGASKHHLAAEETLPSPQASSTGARTRSSRAGKATTATSWSTAA